MKEAVGRVKEVEGATRRVKRRKRRSEAREFIAGGVKEEGMVGERALKGGCRDSCGVVAGFVAAGEGGVVCGGSGGLDLDRKGTWGQVWVGLRDWREQGRFGWR